MKIQLGYTSAPQMDTNEAYPMDSEESLFDEDSNDQVVDEVIARAVFQKDFEVIDLLIKEHADEYLPKRVDTVP